MPLCIYAENEEEAFALARQVYRHADRLIDVQVNNGVIDIVCDPREEAEVEQQLIRAGVKNILSM